jgi:regulator of replication initiation timing
MINDKIKWHENKISEMENRIEYHRLEIERLKTIIENIMYENTG